MDQHVSTNFNNLTGCKMIQPLKKIPLVLLVLALCVLPASTNLFANVRETPIVKIVEEWSPSVVNISTETIVYLRNNPYWAGYGNQFDNFFQDYYRTNIGTLKQNSLGSGVVVSKDGLIVTNAHVIHMASKIFVTLKGEKTVEASVIGVDNANDLALIKISPSHPLKPVKFADDIIIGETAVTIGNPLGLQNSVSAGIISGTNRTSFLPQTSHVFTNLVQTDASINPGSSGGALLNLEGKLIGINVAVVQNAQNIGFAVPAGKVKEMLKEYDKIKDKGYFSPYPRK